MSGTLEYSVKQLFGENAKLTIPVGVKHYSSIDAFFRNATFLQRRMIYWAKESKYLKAIMRLDSEKQYKDFAEDAEDLLNTEIVTDEYRFWVVETLELDPKKRWVTIYVPQILFEKIGDKFYG